MTTTGDRVREARVAAGLSQTALAGNQLSPSYISLIESGRREPTDAALSVIAARLSSTVEYLKFGDEGPVEARVRLALDYARLDLISGEATAARDRLLALDLRSVTRQVRVDSLVTLAQAHERSGDLESAIDVLEPLRAEALADGHLLDVAATSTPLTICYIESGDFARAVDVGDEGLEALERGGLAGTDEHLRLGSSILWAYMERGDLTYATHRAAELIREAERIGTPRGRGSVYWNAALIAEQRHDFALAKRYTERALALLGEGEPSRDLPRLRVTYASYILRTDSADVSLAMEQLEKAAPDLAILGSEIDLARLDSERSRAHLALGDPDRAVQYAQAILDRLSGQTRLEVPWAHVTLGDALYAQGNVDAASRAYSWAAEMLGMMTSSRRAAEVWRELGDRFAGSGDTVRAADAFDRALREAGFRPSVPAAVRELWGADRP